MAEGGDLHGRRDQSQSVGRALQLLEVVASSPEPLTAAELAKRCTLARPTAYRLLVTLERQGYLDRVREHAFALGYKATRMSGIRSSQQALARRARPILEDLTAEAGDTVGLSVPVGTTLTEIDQIDPPRPVRQMSYINTVFPPNCSSNGKLMLSGFSDLELDAFLSHPLERRTERSITDPGLLRTEIATIRERGFGVCLEELYDEINGVSGAIVDGHGVNVGFVSVSGPSFRLPFERLLEAAVLIRRACERIGRAIDAVPRHG